MPVGGGWGAVCLKSGSFGEPDHIHWGREFKLWTKALFDEIKKNFFFQKWKIYFLKFILIYYFVLTWWKVKLKQKNPKKTVKFTS